MTNFTPAQATQVASMMRRRPSQPGRIEKAKNPTTALNRLLHYLRPFRTQLIIVFITVILYTLFGLVGPYLMGVAIDQFIAGKDLAGLSAVASWMLAAYILYNLLNLYANWMMARISQKALQRLRQDLFFHLQKLSMNFFDTHPAGGLMSRLTNDIDAINQTVSQNITALAASVLSMAGILVAMFVLNVWLALASLIVVPLMYGFTQFVAKYTIKGFRELQNKLGGLNQIAEETFSGQKIIKAFRRKNAVMDAFREQNDAVCRSGIYANSYAMLLMPLTNVLGTFFVVVLAGTGGWLALKGLVSVGMIATFINYGQNFVSPLRQIANLYNNVQTALAGAERVFEIIDADPETPDDSDPLPFDTIHGDVSLEHVQFSYVAGTPVIKNFSLEVKAGQIIALVGPTGAGKTTILNLLTRFYEIDQGCICIDGKDIRRIRLSDLRRKLGLVLQDTFLFSDTILENIRFGRLDATDEECIAAAQFAEAEPFIRQLPQGYQTRLSERAGNISQGQRQLLSIARAILANPAILILDEATSSVDTRTEARIQKALLHLMEGRTSFVIAHRLSTIRDADQVVVIDQGEIIEQGTHQELLDQKGFYYQLTVSQFKGIAI